MEPEMLQAVHPGVHLIADLIALSPHGSLSSGSSGCSAVS
jgi:hypothetical protein